MDFITSSGVITSSNLQLLLPTNLVKSRQDALAVDHILHSGSGGGVLPSHSQIMVTLNSFQDIQRWSVIALFCIRTLAFLSSLSPKY